MPKIENEQIYQLENEPKFTDKVIGTDDGENKTKNFSLLAISFSTGGGASNMREQVLEGGNTAAQMMRMLTSIAAGKTNI
ncbi:MAG: hypothetical protein RL311_6 [Bacteroidota bacterium]